MMKKGFGKKTSKTSVGDNAGAGAGAGSGAGKKAKTTVKQSVQDKAIDFIKIDNFEALSAMTDPENASEFKFLNKAHTKSGKTALCVAAEEGRIGSVEILLAAQANVNLYDKNGMTAFLYASKAGELEIMEMLKEGEADMSLKSKGKEDDAVMLATQSNHLKAVEQLENYGLPLDQQNNALETPLSVALKFEYYDISQFLLDRKCDINVTGINGNIPLMRTAFDGRERTTSYITGRLGDLNHQNLNGETALMIACRHKQVNIVKLLLETKQFRQPLKTIRRLIRKPQQLSVPVAEAEAPSGAAVPGADALSAPVEQGDGAQAVAAPLSPDQDAQQLPPGSSEGVAAVAESTAAAAGEPAAGSVNNSSSDAQSEKKRKKSMKKQKSKKESSRKGSKLSFSEEEAAAAAIAAAAAALEEEEEVEKDEYEEVEVEDEDAEAIQVEVNVNAQDFNGRTAVMVCCMMGSYDCLQVLLDDWVSTNLRAKTDPLLQQPQQHLQQPPTSTIAPTPTPTAVGGMDGGGVAGQEGSLLLIPAGAMASETLLGLPRPYTPPASADVVLAALVREKEELARAAAVAAAVNSSAGPVDEAVLESQLQKQRAEEKQEAVRKKRMKRESALQRTTRGSRLLNLEIQDLWGYTALMHLTLSRCRIPAVGMVVAAGQEETDAQKQLTAAALRMVHGCGAFVDAIDRTFSTALMHACQCSGSAMYVIQLLLSLGADPTLRNIDDFTARDLLEYDDDVPLFEEAMVKARQFIADSTVQQNFNESGASAPYKQQQQHMQQLLLKEKPSWIQKLNGKVGRLKPQRKKKVVPLEEEEDGQQEGGGGDQGDGAAVPVVAAAAAEGRLEGGDVTQEINNNNSNNTTVNTNIVGSLLLLSPEGTGTGTGGGSVSPLGSSMLDLAAAGAAAPQT